MDAIFRNLKNTKTSNLLILNFTDKIDLRRSEKNIALSNIVLHMYYITQRET